MDKEKMHKPRWLELVEQMVNGDNEERQKKSGKNER